MVHTFSKYSWINQLNKQYKKVSIEKLDRANEIVTKALTELEELNK